MTQRSVCVYCSSSVLLDPGYYALASRVGAGIAARGLRLVYGGAQVGMMGAAANAALDAGGSVLGVIPTSLMERELAHNKLTELVVLESMHLRKARMELESTAFLALPGGFGTLDELFDVLTLRQIGLHSKRVALVNHAGFYGPLVEWVRSAVRERFVPANVKDALEVLGSDEALEQWLDAVAAE